MKWLQSNYKNTLLERYIDQRAYIYMGLMMSTSMDPDKYSRHQHYFDVISNANTLQDIVSSLKGDEYEETDLEREKDMFRDQMIVNNDYLTIEELEWNLDNEDDQNVIDVLLEALQDKLI